jgi:hypothetical protein
MLQKFSLMLLTVFCLSVCADAAGSAAWAGDRSPGQYQSPGWSEGEYRTLNRSPYLPRTQSRERYQYQPHPITNSGESREDDNYYYLSREDERYLDSFMKTKPQVPTVKLPSGLAVQLVLVRTPSGATCPITHKPLYNTRYMPAKKLVILP